MLKIRGAKLRLMHLCDRVLSLQCFFFFFFFFLFPRMRKFWQKNIFTSKQKNITKRDWFRVACKRSYWKKISCAVDDFSQVWKWFLWRWLIMRFKLFFFFQYLFILFLFVDIVKKINHPKICCVQNKWWKFF